MSNPKSYPHHPKTVRVVETHSALIFLASPYVYKIKKAVNLGFLDFSSLAKRRYYCEREVELNERLGKGVYLGVIAIKQSGHGFGFGQTGKTIEYAVWMKRLSDRYFLNHLVHRNEVGSGDLDRIVTKLKSFYQAQHPSAEVEKWGRVAALRINTNENFQQTKRFIGSGLSNAAWRALQFYTNGFLRHRRPLFDDRIREGWIRDCHGDLHLEHIHLTKRSLHIYDCIEFNDRFRYVDVANDVAFLAMDLDHEGRSDLSQYFVAQMAQTLGDRGMPALIDFYKCYRAYVRGKVESLQSEADMTNAERRPLHARRAVQYFRQALGYSVAGSQPLILVVMGGIGCGKSTLAQNLANELGWKMFSSDVIRKQLAGLPLTVRPPVEIRSKIYSPDWTRRTYRTLLAKAESEVKAGRSVILDATFSRRSHRNDIRRQFNQSSSTVRFVEARVKQSIVRKRLMVRENEAGTVSDARMEDHQKLVERYEPPSELPKRARIQVDTSGSLSQSVAQSLRGLIQAQNGW